MPIKRAIEEDFPIVEINRLAAPERNAFKPVYQMHKWFARRASSIFRALLLGALKPAGTNIMEEFYKDHANDPDTNGKVVLDPFMGGGTTVVEALRLGCKVVGIDLNPQDGRPKRHRGKRYGLHVVAAVVKELTGLERLVFVTDEAMRTYNHRSRVSQMGGSLASHLRGPGGYQRRRPSSEPISVSSARVKGCTGRTWTRTSASKACCTGSQRGGQL